MGTHPIFESDFDCLTDGCRSDFAPLAPPSPSTEPNRIESNQTESNRLAMENETLKKEQQALLEKHDFDAKEFKECLAHHQNENDKLKAHNDDLVANLDEMQEMIGKFSGNLETNMESNKRILVLESENEDLTKENAEQKSELEQWRNSGLSGKQSEMTEALTSQTEKYKVACAAQKRYIETMTEALRISDESREKLKAVQEHRGHLIEQVKAFESLRGAEEHQNRAGLEYRKVLERKTEESDGLVEKYKIALDNVTQDRDACSSQLAAKDKLVDTFKRQTDTMKALIKQYEIDNQKKTDENNSLLQKINRLIEINQDLINVKQKEQDAADKETLAAPKVVVEGSPEAEATFLKIQLQNSQLERDLEKSKILVNKLRGENTLQGTQIENLNEKFLLIDTSKMEAEEKIKALQKKIDSQMDKQESEPKRTEPQSAIESKMHELNKKLVEQMTVMKSALDDTRKEKEEILIKSDKLIKASTHMKDENQRLQGLVMELQEQLDERYSDKAEQADSQTAKTQAAEKPAEPKKKSTTQKKKKGKKH